MHVSTETRKHGNKARRSLLRGAHDLGHGNRAPGVLHCLPVALSTCRRRPLSALHLIASFIPWTKVSPPLITCPSVGYFARYSEKTGANGEWDTLYMTKRTVLNGT